MSAQLGLGREFLRLACVVIAAVALLVAFGGSHDVRTIASASQLENFGRHCLNVVDFGADPTGVGDSTTAFRAAFQSATIQNGAAVCAPAGTFTISSDILMYSAATAGPGSTRQGGTSFFGAGPGLTILVVTSGGNVFDSCPGYSNVTATLPVPASCPPTLPSYPGPTPNPNSLLHGVVLSNFSILHSPLPGNVPLTDFMLPAIQGLLVDNVCVTNSTNVFDLGEQTHIVSYAAIRVRHSTCGYSFSGHFMALHGNGSDVTVEGNQIYANGRGVGLDTTDLSDGVFGSISNMTWINNRFEQPLIGMMDFAGGPASGSGSTVVGPGAWKANTYDGCVAACYYIGADPNGATLVPVVGDFKIADRAASSRYDAIYIDGGAYIAGGVQGITVGGSSSYSGSAGGTASSLLVIRGTPVPTTGDIWIVWSPTSSVHQPVAAGNQPNAIASALAHLIGPNPVAQQVPLANPWYGMLDVSLTATPPAGSYTASPYEVIINSTGLTPVGLPTVAAGCTPPGGGSSYPCWTSAFDVGDGIAIRHNARNIDVVGSRVTSQAGAAIHIWANGGDQFHFLNDVLGMDQGTNSYTGLQIDSGTTNPVNYYFEGNDFVGATKAIVNAVPTPSFLGTGAAAASRANRGAFAYTVGPTTVSSGSAITISNAGPLDCTFYFDWTTLPSVTSTLALPGTSATSLPGLVPPWQVDLPVGAQLVMTPSGSFSVKYTGYCRP